MSDVFLIGPPKTGTTFLSRLLDQHPDVCVVHESYVMVDKDDIRNMLSTCMDKARQHGFSFVDVRRWRETPRQQVVFESGEDFKKRTGAKLCVNSWPYWYQHLDFLRTNFPAASYIYTTRHPAAVYVSHKTFENYSPDRPNLGWGAVWDLLCAHAEMAVFEPYPLTEVRYEALVNNPDMLRDVFEELELDPTRYPGIKYDIETDPFPDRWGWIQNATDMPDPSRVNRWKDEITESDRTRVEVVCADYFREHEYIP